MSNERPADRHGPGEISRRDAADASDPRFARQAGPSAMADADALLIRKLIVAALEGSDAHADLGKAFGTRSVISFRYLG